MKVSHTLTIILSAAALAAPAFKAEGEPDNPNIDMAGYLKIAGEAAGHRESRRISEDEFIHMSREPGTIVLDARSADKFQLLHVAGAINLSFPDIDIESLKKALPDKAARILIYCNNNFRGNQTAMASKRASASLNISTYITLYNYGYTNVYELAPYVDVHTTKLPLAGSMAPTGSLEQPVNLSLSPNGATNR